jgi:hypothetical protein
MQRDFLISGCSLVKMNGLQRESPPSLKLRRAKVELAGQKSKFFEEDLLNLINLK